MRRARTTGAPLRLRFLALFLQRKVKDAGRRPQLTWLAWGLALSDLHMFGTSVGAWYLPSSPQANDTIPSWQTPWSRSVAYRHAEEHGSVSDLLAAHIGSCPKPKAGCKWCQWSAAPAPLALEGSGSLRCCGGQLFL